METKNSILARQKEMQLSLDKVKHLIRLIQAFNFNQALAETEGKGVRLQDGARAVLGSGAAAEVGSVEKRAVSSKLEEQQTGGGGSGGSTVLTICPGAGTGVAVGLSGLGGHTETAPSVEAQSETDAAPAALAAVATTNGTTEPPCPAHSPVTAAAENKLAVVNPAETLAEKKQEELSDGSSNNKTSEPSQHLLPALLNSLDDKK